MRIEWRDLHLHIFAFVAPIYMIFYPPLHDEPRSPRAKQLWRSLAAGVCCYLVLGALLISR